MCYFAHGMRKNFFVFLLIGISLSLVGCDSFDGKRNMNSESAVSDTMGGESPPAPYDEEKVVANEVRAAMIDSVIERYVAKKQFNGVVLVGENDHLVYQGVKGFGNHRKFEPLTLNTSFHLASVSKQFTAVAIMMLEEEGRLRYTDTVGGYFENFPYKGITIEQLLNHTSGLPDISEYIPQFLGFWDTCKIAVNEDVPWILTNLKPAVKFLPGRRFSYSNTGYIILALIIERVSGRSYSAFVKERIFDPLGMEHSFVYQYDDLHGCPVTAKAYTSYKHVYVPFEDDIRNGLVGEKGIYASAPDLYKWDQALYTDKLISRQTLNKAFSRGTLENGKPVNYGYGWRIPRKADNIVYHFGNWKGSRAAFIRVLDDRYTIILLNNTSSRKLRAITRDILDILYHDQENKPDF